MKLCSSGLSNKAVTYSFMVIIVKTEEFVRKLKDEEFVRKLKDEQFVCNAGWIDHFKLCYNITFRKVSDEYYVAEQWWPVTDIQGMARMHKNIV